MKKQRKKGADNMAVFAVPSNKPFIISEEEADKIFKNQKNTPLTQEEREKVKQNAEKWFKKPDKEE